MKEKSNIKNAPATVAKIRVIAGRRLTDENYDELLNCRSVGECAEYLKGNTHYGDILSSVDTNTVHRGMLEDLLRKSVFLCYKRVTDFEQLERHEFYNFRIVKAEVDELLRSIRYMNAGSREHIKTIPVYMNEHMSYDLLGLAGVNDYADLLRFVKPTPYYNVLKKFEPEHSGEMVNYTKCEVGMRTYYYKRLLDSLSAFDNESEQKIRELIEIQIDLINIINSYRMTKYFHEEGKDINRLMIPFGKMSEEKMNYLYDSVDENDFAIRFSKTKYGRLLVENGLEKLDIETAAFRLKHKYASKALSSSQTACVSVYAITQLLEDEVSNITRIIEGIRYGVEPNKIRALLLQ